jgi:UDP-N-acetylmuramoylalanine--D-glutamate ligase
VLFGEAADLIDAALREGGLNYPLFRAADLQDAVKKAEQIAEDGDSVLLSPGGTSFDAYRDFEERGEYFRQWVKELP